MKKGKCNKSINGVLIGILFLFAMFIPHCVAAQKVVALDTIIHCNEVVYGKKFYAICQTMLIELAGSKPGYMKPCIGLFVYYNPSTGKTAFPDIVGVHKADKEMLVTGKADFEVFAIDKDVNGYNEHFGKDIGVLGETGKYFAIRAKVHYDGSKKDYDRLQVKYKVKLIDKEKYEKKYKW